MIKKFASRDKLEPKAPRRLRQKADVFAPRPMGGLSRLKIRALPRRPGAPVRGVLIAGGQAFVCALGGAGIGTKRREGDGVTPRGIFAILGWLARFDRRGAFRAGRQNIGKSLGWCDDPASPCYNRPVTLPFSASCETMRRDDRLYDVVGVIDYNIRARAKGRGSAIFMHIAQKNYLPTAGCIALSETDMARLTRRLARKTQISIGAARAPKIAEPTRTWVASS